MIHTVKGFSIVNALLMIQGMLSIWSLVLLLFLNPAWTSRSSWPTYCWSLAWRILSNTNVWDECNCAVVWAFFAISSLWAWNENYLFQSYGHCWVFHICWHIECNTFTAPSLRTWNSSTGILSPPVALFLVMLLNAHLTSHSRMSGSRWVMIIRSWRCDHSHSPRAEHPGMWSQVGLRKHHYEKS